MASKKEKLMSSKDVANAIVNGQQNSNDYRVTVLGLRPLTVYAVVYPIEKETITTNNMKIEDISLYYNLQNFKSNDGI